MQHAVELSAAQQKCEALETECASHAARTRLLEQQLHEQSQHMAHCIATAKSEHAEALALQYASAQEMQALHHTAIEELRAQVSANVCFNVSFATEIVLTAEMIVCVNLLSFLLQHHAQSESIAAQLRAAQQQLHALETQQQETSHSIASNSAASLAREQEREREQTEQTQRTEQLRQELARAQVAREASESRARIAGTHHLCVQLINGELAF